MSLVDLDTGEIIDRLDEEEARSLTNRIRQCVAVAHESIVHAYKGRAWTALNYGSWDDYCEAEFGGARLPIPKADRSDVVALLRAEGMSTRAIGSALGLSKDTVHRDLAGVSDETPAVTGADGKTYPAQQPERAEAGTVGPEDRGAGESDSREASAPEDVCPPSVEVPVSPAPEPEWEEPTFDDALAQHEDEGVAGNPPPVAPSAPPIGDFLQGGEITLLDWRLKFTTKCSAVTKLMLLSPGDIATRADAEWLDHFGGVVRNFDRWWAEVEELRLANSRLRIVQGGSR